MMTAQTIIITTDQRAEDSTVGCFKDAFMEQKKAVEG